MTTAATEMPARTRVAVWRNIFSLLRELWAAQPWAALAVLAILLIGGTQEGLTIAAMGGLVDALIRSDQHAILIWLGVYIGTRMLEELYWTTKNFAAHTLLDHAVYRVQRSVLERAGAAPLIQFEEGTFFTHLQRASANLGERLSTVAMGVIDLLQLLLWLGSIAVVLVTIHPLLLPLLLAGSLPAIWLQSRIAAAVYQAQRAHTTHDRIRRHIQQLLTGRESAAEIRLFGAATYLLSRWETLRRDRTRDILHAERTSTLFTTAGSLISGVAYAAALVLVAFLILRGQLSVGNYVTVAAGALGFETLLGALTGLLRSLEEQSRFLGDLFDFQRIARTEPPTQHASTHSQAEHSTMPERGIVVEATGVSFTYPGAAQPAVRNISLRIQPGERIAIVGANGAGKTTLAKLLTGLYQPDTGAVYLNGTALTDGHGGEVRSRIAAVFQDYATFQVTARENIGFGSLAHLQDDDALATAAERAGIAELIQQLPHGFDTYLGRQFGETDLSGGQWQRIALARAFFRDAGLLLLDEPTAALDPLAELALFARFAELVSGRTAIMNSHRLGAARLADRILVMQNGALVEQGSHDDLLARGGVYAAMFEAQAQWYR